MRIAEFPNSVFYFLSAAQMLGSTRAIQLSLFQDCIELSMGLMFLIPSSIVSPGADMCIYFPYCDKEKRLTAFHNSIVKLLFGAEQNDEHMSIFQYYNVFPGFQTLEHLIFYLPFFFWD